MNHMNLKKTKLDHLYLMLEDLEDAKALQETALLEFKYGDWYAPTADQLAGVRTYTREHIGQDIGDIRCEIERRNPGTFIRY